MGVISVNINGIETVIKNVKGVKEEVEKILKREFTTFGIKTVTSAKRKAPVDEGALRNSIAFKLEGLQVEITVGVNYAAYLEFGTKKFAAAYVSTLPLEWQAFAAQFKGKGGGSFEEFVMRLVRWVQIKGLSSKVGKQSKKTTAEADAYAIALYIIRNGIKPHPYFVPAIEENKIILVANLKKALL